MDLQMTRDLTEFETHLLKSQEVMIVRGKVRDYGLISLMCLSERVKQNLRNFK